MTKKNCPSNFSSVSGSTPMFIGHSFSQHTTHQPLAMGIFPKLDPKKKKLPSYKKDRIIKDEQRQAGYVTIIQKIAELGRDPPDYQTSPILGKDLEGEGNGDAKDETIHRYKTIWHNFLDFCILMEDWESAIILYRDKCPPNPLPVRE